jgi:hypothetical protein
MSKRIVLKSVIAVVMVGFVLSFSSCKKPEEQKPNEKPDIVGKWKIEKTEITDFACSDPLMTVMLKPILQQYMGSGIGEEIEFTKDGKMIISSPYGGATAEYTVSNGKLTFISDGTTDICDISFPDKKTMWMDDNAGEEERYKFSEMLSVATERDIQITKLSSRTILKKQ